MNKVKYAVEVSLAMQPVSFRCEFETEEEARRVGLELRDEIQEEFYDFVRDRAYKGWTSTKYGAIYYIRGDNICFYIEKETLVDGDDWDFGTVEYETIEFDSLNYYDVLNNVVDEEAAEQE